MHASGELTSFVNLGAKLGRPQSSCSSSSQVIFLIVPRSKPSLMFAIKAEVTAPRARTFTFTAHKTMYGGKLINDGDTVFVFASETQGGQGLIARGIVTHAEAIAMKPGISRQTPRVSVTIRRTALAKRPLGRRELKHLTDWKDGRPGTELNFKFYRQSTNKIVGISDQTAAFLSRWF
jgi:hypothetical protein